MSEFFEGGTSWSGHLLVLPVALAMSINGVEHQLQFEQDPHKNIYYHPNGMASSSPTELAISLEKKCFIAKYFLFDVS
jgi:hypothetical protein